MQMNFDAIRSGVSDEVLRRFDSIYENYLAYHEAKGLDESETFINKAILRIAVESCYDDIIRCKVYADLKVADRHKMAGYTIKWLSKLKPIQSRNINDSRIILINNEFSILCGLSFILEDNPDQLGNISGKYMSHLMYETQYRTVSGRSYASKLYLLELLLKNKIAV